MIYNHNEIEDYLRNQPENLTPPDESDLLEYDFNQSYENLKTIKMTTEYNRIQKIIKHLETEFNSIPYMCLDLSVEQELENSDKRLDLKKRIENYKNILNGE